MQQNADGLVSTPSLNVFVSSAGACRTGIASRHRAQAVASLAMTNVLTFTEKARTVDRRPWTAHAPLARNDRALRHHHTKKPA